MLKKPGILMAIAAVFVLIAALACTKEVVKEVEVEKIVIEKEIVEVPVEVVVTKEVIKEVPVVEVVTKEVVKEVEVQVEKTVEAFERSLVALRDEGYI